MLTSPHSQQISGYHTIIDLGRVRQLSIPPKTVKSRTTHPPPETQNKAPSCNGGVVPHLGGNQNGGNNKATSTHMHQEWSMETVIWAQIAITLDSHHEHHELRQEGTITKRPQNKLRQLHDEEQRRDKGATWRVEEKEYQKERSRKQSLMATIVGRMGGP